MSRKFKISEKFINIMVYIIIIFTFMPVLIELYTFLKNYIVQKYSIYQFRKLIKSQPLDINDVTNDKKLIVKEIDSPLYSNEIKKEVYALIDFYQLGLSPKLIDVFGCKNKTYIIMQSMDTTVYKYLNDRRKDMTSLREFLQLYKNIMDQIKSKIKIANQQNLYHNDLHTDNIMLKLDPNDKTKITDMKIIDFGLSSYYKNKNNKIENENFIMDKNFYILYLLYLLFIYIYRNNFQNNNKSEDFWNVNENILDYFKQINKDGKLCKYKDMEILQERLNQPFKNINKGYLFDENEMFNKERLIKYPIDVFKSLLNLIINNCILFDPNQHTEIVLNLFDLLIKNNLIKNDINPNDFCLGQTGYNLDNLLESPNGLYSFIPENFQYIQNDPKGCDNEIIRYLNKELNNYDLHSECKWVKGTMLGFGMYGSAYKVTCEK